MSDNSSKSWERVSDPAMPLSADLSLIKLADSDNVAIAARDITKGETLGDIVALTDVPKGHKVAIEDFKEGDIVRKYAQMIGFASKDIKVGEHIHVHNLAFRNTNPDYKIGSEVKETLMVKEDERATFMGYRRGDGKVGTRNYVVILPSVNCSATASRRIAEHFNNEEMMANYENVDGVVAFIHGTGCGMDTDGEGFKNLQAVMHGYATHPNVAGVLIVGLGCETNQLETLIQDKNMKRGVAVKTFNIQSVGGLAKTVQLGVKTVEKLLVEANKFTREECPASELTLALQCGGSDGFSGITANPALGYAADLLVVQGGTAIIAETPEVYGAEHLLTMRSSSDEVAKNLISRIKWWEDYTSKNGGTMDNNPSPGNKLGGLTTILEKSLGAVAKGGTTNLNEFIGYSQPATKKGLLMMDSPGFDPASVTGQIASGSNLVAFTTGRGSCFGSKPSPTLKISTNSETYKRMPDDMDVNAGVIVTEGATIEQVGKHIFDMLLDLASGKKSKSEAQGLGDYEFVPWQIGATM